MPKHHTNVNSFLTPILGLYGINVKDFVAEFENKTKFIINDIIIPLRIRISKIKTYEMYVQTPYVGNMANICGEIDLLSVYKLSLIKNIRMFDLGTGDLKKTYTNVRKYLPLFSKELNKPVENLLVPKNFPVFLKKNLSGLPLMRNIHENKYGAFVSFVNATSFKLDRAQKQLKSLGISFRKLNTSKNFNICNVYYMSVYDFDNLKKINSVFTEKSYSLIPLFYRYNNNILPYIFVSAFIKAVEKSKNVIVPTPNIFKIILLISVIMSKTIKLINANLSSTIKTS